jgi:hypothetical protein
MTDVPDDYRIGFDRVKDEVGEWHHRKDSKPGRIDRTGNIRELPDTSYDFLNPPDNGLCGHRIVFCIWS